MPTDKPCRVISVFSTKGGVGKTLIAANLAESLRVLHHSKTAVLPLESSNDDAAILLGSTGVQRLPDPVTAASLPSVLEELRRAVAFVIIDAGSVLSELAVTAFEHSNLLLLVMTPDVLSLTHTRRTVELLASLQFPLQMVRVVINRADSHGHVRSRDIKERLPAEVIAEIPSDGKTVGLSVNRGVPFMASQDGTRIHESFKRFARALIELPALFVEPFTVDRSKLPATTSELFPLSPQAPSNEQGTEVADPIAALKHRIRAKLVERFDLKRLDLNTLNDPRKAQQLREQTAQVALELITEEGGFVASRERRLAFVKEIVDDALGLGPLEDLMEDPDVSDILVNAKDQIYVERHGKLFLTEKKFGSNDQLLNVIERIIAPLGRRIDESAPMVDARLPDGSRVNAIIPPLSIRGPILSIRKFSRERYTMEDLVTFGTLTRQMAEFLTICVRARKNIIVSGGTGSGKTTVLNVLSSSILEDERIVTIEDAAELRLAQEHWVPLETRQPNVEGRGGITARQLFRNTLRMRPDRVLIGECRGDETFDMLQAMNTGHDGSLTTLHANSPQDVIARLDSLVLMSNVDLPVRAIREQIAAAIHLVVHTARFPDGSRKITHISEVVGMDERADIVFNHLFLFRQEGVGPRGEVQGSFQAPGRRSALLDDLKTKGFRLDDSAWL